MNADVRLGQDCNAGYAAHFERMQMDVQEGGVCGTDSFDQSALYALRIVEICGLEKVNNQVGPGESLAITRSKRAL
jgi:hypothetical protein